MFQNIDLRRKRNGDVDIFSAEESPIKMLRPYEYRQQSLNKSLLSIPLSDYDKLPIGAASNFPKHSAQPNVLHSRMYSESFNNGGHSTKLQPVSDKFKVDTHPSGIYPKSSIHQFPQHVFDGTLPKSLLDLFQQFFCKLCQFQFDRMYIGQLHYESKSHMKNVQQFLKEYSEETGGALHPLALEPIKKKKEEDSFVNFCRTCKLGLNSKSQAEAHFAGKNHLRHVHHKEMYSTVDSESVKTMTTTSTTQITTSRYRTDELGINQTVDNDPGLLELPKQFASKQDKIKAAFCCDVCEITVTCEEHLHAHLDGQKHRNAIKVLNSKQLQPEGGSLACEICNVKMNSKHQFDRHMLSKKHQTTAQWSSKKLCISEDVTQITNTIPRPQFEILSASPVLQRNTNMQSVKNFDNTEKSIQSGKANILCCAVCNVYAESIEELNLHVTNRQHIQKVNEIESKGYPSQSQEYSNVQALGSNIPSNSFYRKTYNVTEYSEYQLHLDSKQQRWSSMYK